ncbi:chromate resistance protein ChrB domain-containing protein [Citricoccus parietis]|uniref:Chromate resistance protein ChrB domain-containing protein n=1 Tax=Citricoccus parietis TaxID=592307 RepID=A0ABV5G6F4_9MICC
MIRRFVDADAQFRFAGWDEAVDPADPRSFGMAGAQLGSHDEDGTCFAKVLQRHDLAGDEALVRLEACVNAGVRHALSLPRVPTEEAVHRIGLSLDSVGIGFSVLHPDDLNHLEAATPLYDALYTYFQLPDLAALELPATQPERVSYLRSLVG